MPKLLTKFTNAEELQKLVDEYFFKYPHIDEATTQEEKAQAKQNLLDGILPTISGLCYYIGLQSINDWNTLKNKQKYKRICDKVVLRLTRFWEGASATGRGQTGVSNWLSTFANFPTSQENQGNKGVCAVVVIGADGNKQALSDIISASQAQRIQGIKTIEAQSQALPSPRNVSRETIKNKPRKNKDLARKTK